MSLGETQMRPTAMLFRNLASMDVEESIRANPVDGVVLLMGCDKTTPSLLMGAASVDLPTIGVSGGPSLSGNWRGKPLGSGTGVIEMSEMVRAGTLSHGRVHRGRGLHAAIARQLHDHGHRLDDGEPGGGTGHVAAGKRRHSRGGFAPHAPGASVRPPHRRDGARGPAHVEDADARGIRERHPRQRRHRRLDQRSDPPARAGRPTGRAARRWRTGIAWARSCPAWST